MSDTSTASNAQQFRAGEPLVWVSDARRGVEFLQLSSENTALVKLAGANHVVPLTELERPAPISPQSVGLASWFRTPTPPTPPSDTQLTERLAAGRAALARSHSHVKDIQTRLDEARRVVQRAESEHATALAALRSYDSQARRDQILLEEALQTGRPLPVLTNGHGDPRHYVQHRVDSTAAALTKFQSAVADQMQAMGEALAAVRRHAADIIALQIAVAVENLRFLEVTAATTRAELVSVASAGWWPDAQLGPVKLPPATAQYLEQQPAWQDVPAVRMGGPQGRTKPWRDLFDRLCQDADADFRLGE
jgi:hypothetical protein